MTVFRIVGAVDTEAVEGARLQSRHITVPDLMSVFRELQPGDLYLAAWVVETQLDALRMGRENREIDALAVKVGAELKPGAGLDDKMVRFRIHVAPN